MPRVSRISKALDQITGVVEALESGVGYTGEAVGEAVKGGAIGVPSFANPRGGVSTFAAVTTSMWKASNVAPYTDEEGQL